MAYHYRMAAFDMDGTLLNREHQITPRVLTAIHKAAEAGRILALNTGRCLAELTEYIEILPEVRYVNCLSGALVLDTWTGETLFSAEVPEDTVLQLMALTSDEDLMLHLLSRGSYAQADCIARMDAYQMATYQPMFMRLCTGVENIRCYYRAAPFTVNKVNFYHRSAADRVVTRARIEAAGVPVTLADAEITSLECSPIGINKGVGLSMLAERLGFTMEDVIVVGDADNDRAALQVAGLPIAMANATPAIKAICKAEVADCDHDGCAEVIERYLL